MRWSERQAVTFALFGFALVLLGMAGFQPKLWEVDTFKTILQAVVITGLLNMIAAFHFAANKSSETASENTGKAFSAIEAAARATPPAEEQPDMILQPGQTAQAAEEQP